MERLGRVEFHTRYSVKSMLGEQPIGFSEITWSGVVGDRRWLVLKEDDTVLTAKKKEGERLLRVTAILALTQVHLHFGLGSDQLYAVCGSREADDELSRFLDQRVRLVPVDDRARPTNAGFGLRPDSGADSSPLHLVTTASLEAIGDGESVDDRRLRPNVVIRTPDGVTGFVENDWVDRVIQIGPKVKLYIRKRTERCSIPWRPQLSLPEDGALRKRLPRTNDGCVGVYATVVEPGRIRTRDEVVLL